MKTTMINHKSVSRDANELIEMADSMCRKPLSQCDYSSAFQLYQEAAKLGSSDASDRIGWCYCSGLGVEKDTHQAAVHFLKAARMGNVSAMYNLAHIMNDDGNGSRMGQEKAVYWFEKAAENGITKAYWNLGFAYLNGEGVRTDYDKAMQWFIKGGDLGYSACYTQAGVMCFQGLGVEQNYTNAASWFEKAISGDNSDAYLYLGHCYEYGKGVRRSLKKADWHYERADMFGNVNALDEIFAFEKRHPFFKLYKRVSTLIKFFKCHIKYLLMPC